MTDSRKRKPSAILMVTMEPADGDEREFHDWYDLEHVPERAAIKQFRTFQRYVCLEGWPRYMAIYDLDYFGVLAEPAYASISGAHFSPWTKRIIAGVHGWVRVEAVQLLPGNAHAGAKGRPLRVAMLRFRGVAAGDEGNLGGALRNFLAPTPGVMQFRLFQASAETDGDLYAIIELSTPLSISGFDWNRLVMPSGHVDIANMYSRYWRKGA
jgi:hypothetical protein